MQTQPLSPIVGMLAASSLALASCQTAIEQPPSELGQARIVSAAGEPIGDARFYRQSEETTLNIALTGLQSGELSVYLSEGGACPVGSQALAPETITPLPQIAIGMNGSGTMSAVLSTESAAWGQLLDEDGTAIAVFRQAPDASLTEIGCGVLRPR